MQFRLNQGDMGVVSLKEKLLDDMEGIRIAGSGALHILAAGEVKIAGSEVRVAGTGGVLLYEGTAEADQEGNIVVASQGKIELSAEDGERAIHNRGKEVTYYLAWEHEDLSHPSNRYRDAPPQKDYDWMKLGTHVAAGLMVAGGIAALAAGGVFLVGAAAATAAKIGMTVFLAGSVVGFLTGASGLLMTEASLWGVLALGFGEGFVGSIVTQKLLNEDGEIDWGIAIAEAGFSAVTAGLAWKERRGVRGGGESGAGNNTTNINPKDIRFSQSSVNGSEEIIECMKKDGWKGDPIDVVQMPDGVYTTIDNTRVVSAREAGINVQANVHGYNDSLPTEYIERFTTKKGIPTTWGEAVELRVGKQKASFRNGNSYGEFNMEDIK